MGQSVERSNVGLSPTLEISPRAPVGSGVFEPIVRVDSQPVGQQSRKLSQLTARVDLPKPRARVKEINLANPINTDARARVRHQVSCEKTHDRNC